jgi:hypothetical protein
MDSKNFREILEAYTEVYAPQEVDEATAMAKRGYDEAPIRQKIAKSTGGGEAADRASALEKKSTFGDAKKAKARQELARKQRGDFRKTTSSSPGLHGYGHKSDDPKVKAKQAARGSQRGALTPAEKKQFNREEFDVFDTVLEFLYVEGFAETLEEAEWVMANLIDEEAIDIILDEGKVELDQERRSRMGKQIGKKVRSAEAEYSLSKDTMYPKGLRGAMEKGARKKVGQAQKIMGALKSAQKEAFEAWLDEAMTNYEKNRKRAAQRAAARNEARKQGKTGAVPGVGYVTPRPERETWTDESGKTRHAKGL